MIWCAMVVCTNFRTLVMRNSLKQFRVGVGTRCSFVVRMNALIQSPIRVSGFRMTEIQVFEDVDAAVAILHPF